MSRRTFLVFLGGAFLIGNLSAAPAAQPPSPVADIISNPLPWSDGESLTYLISWTTLQAAEGTFTAHDKGDHWEFNLALTSRGVVNTIYPFTGQFWSLLSKSPWRSIEYGEYRFEPRRTIKERTQIDYTAHQGTREVWSEGKTKTFPIAEDAVDDVGTMLYHLRAWPLKPGDKRTLYVYESDSEKQGEVECQARETRAFGIWPAQPLLRVMAVPTVGTHRRGHLLCWMTDDARHLPIHAELEFRYGTFVLDLTKTDKLLPLGH
jgi:hypothetical protein